MDADRIAPDAARARRLGRIKLLALAAFFLLPVAAGYVAYSWWTPAQASNYGELLPPLPIEDASIVARIVKTLADTIRAHAKAGA